MSPPDPRQQPAREAAPGPDGDLDPSPAPGTPVARGPVLRQLVLLCAGVVAGLFAFDLALGWLDEARDLSGEPMHQADPELGWTVLPGFRNAKTTISSLGLRSPEIPGTAPRDELRILGVGASTVFGAGKGGPDMDHTWSVYLEAECARRFPGHWRVLNGGVMGYSAVQAARRAIRLIPLVQPDLVLLFVAPGSQMLLDPSSTRHYVHVGVDLLPLDIASVCPQPLLPLAATVHGALTHSSIYRRYRARASDQGRRSAEIDKFVLSRATLAPGLAEVVEPMLERTWDELEALALAARAQGVALRVVLLYEPYMDSDEAWRAYLHGNAAAGAPPVGTPREQSLDALREACERRGITCWSLGDVITHIGSDHRRFTCDDAHWSPEGHAAVAEGLAELLAADPAPDADTAPDADPAPAAVRAPDAGGAPGGHAKGDGAGAALIESLQRARAARPRD